MAPDIHAVRAAVQAAGSEPIAETTDRQRQFHAGGPAERYGAFAARDPDGIAVELSAADARVGPDADRGRPRRRADGAARGRRVMFDWLQWAPRVPGAAYAEPSHVGIMRCALEVDDLRASYAALASSAWSRSGQITVPEPETWDLGPSGALEVVTFTDPEGVGFQLVQQLPWANATLDSFHVRASYGG